MYLATQVNPTFFTATILEWRMLLQPEAYKKILLESLAFLAKENRVLIFAYVIMDNHIHIIWQPVGNYSNTNIQLSFLRFTAQQIKFDLQKNNPVMLEEFRVNAKDREYQFWERNPLHIELFSNKACWQKIEYIHNNPVKAGLCKLAENYAFSSACFYYTGVDKWGYLTHIDG
jgi:putative transposase